MAKVKRGHWPGNPLHNLALNSPTGLNFLLGWMRIGCLYPSHTTTIGFSCFFLSQDILGNMMLSYNACFEDPDHPTRMIHLKNDHRPSRNTAWHSSLWKASISQVDGAASRCRISCIFLGQRATLHSTSQNTAVGVANETANLWSLRDAWNWNSNALWVLELISLFCRDLCSQSSWFRLQPFWDWHDWLVVPVLFDRFVLRRIPDQLHGCFQCLYQQDARKGGLSMRLRQFNLLAVSLLFNLRAVHQRRVTDPSVLAT